MLVAKSEQLGRIVSGPEVCSLTSKNHHSILTEGFACPICEKRVVYHQDSFDQTNEYFRHIDGSSDCFRTESASDEHRIATEVTLKRLYNRIKEVTGEPVEIDVEKWIGIRRKFIIVDIRVSSPLRVAAEVYYKADHLALGRKLNTMFANNYQAYLIFHRDGRHNIDKVERHIRRIAPLSVGRFNPENLELKLGDIFSEQQINLSRSHRKRLPNYIAI